MGGSKYNNKKIFNQYGTFDSNKEYLRYLLLLDRQKKDEISCLQRQVKYELVPAQYETVTRQLKTKSKHVQKLKEKSVNYYADYQYVENGNLVVEDVKGMRTKEYIIKRKLMLYIHGITIKEI